MIARAVFWSLAAVLLPLMVALSTDFGATWDEPQQRAKAQRLIAYWAGETDVLEDPIDGAHLYGAPLDVISTSLEPWIGADPYVIRHAVNATVGWAGLVLAGLLAARLFSFQHGILTMLLLAANPQYLAHSMNNPKDLPFATAATAILLAMTCVSRRSPFIDARTAVLLALLLGLSLNIRAGALLFVVYLVVLVGYYASRDVAMVRWDMASVAVRIAAVLAVAVSIGWIAWPWAYGHPLTAPFRAVGQLSHFPWGGSVLFGGREYPGVSVPWAYIPQWLWMTAPPVLTVGVALSVFGFRRAAMQERLAALCAVVVFPVIYIIATRSTLYDGVRHLLFIIPPLTILAAAGWVGMLNVQTAAFRRIVLTVLAGGLIEPLYFQVQNHPNQVTYVQPLAGGPAAAFANYDLDYWGNCMLSALERVDKRAMQPGVRVTGWPLLILHANASRVPGLTVVDVADGRATYFIALARGGREDLLRLAVSPAVIDHVTTADGALLCATLTGSEWFPRETGPVVRHSLNAVAR